MRGYSHEISDKYTDRDIRIPASGLTSDVDCEYDEEADIILHQKERNRDTEKHNSR